MASKRGRVVYADPRWRRVRREVLTRAAWRCERCGLTDILEVHHVDPVAGRRGAPVDADYDPSRLVAICKPCHWKITAKNQRQENPAWKALVDELRN